jgi:hypothetical protein
MTFDQTLDAISTILRNTDDLYAGQAHGHLDELQINHYNLINKHEALQAERDALREENERLKEIERKAPHARYAFVVYALQNFNNGNQDGSWTGYIDVYDHELKIETIECKGCGTFEYLGRQDAYRLKEKIMREGYRKELNQSILQQ